MRIRPVPLALEVLVIFWFNGNTYMHTYELEIFTIENNEIL